MTADQLLLQEGVGINLGLGVLNRVIRGLASSGKVNQTHIPYRESKLTQVKRKQKFRKCQCLLWFRF